MKVCIVGDSHASYLFGRANEVNITSLPGRTMHRIARDGIVNLLNSVECRDSTVFIFVFGEIDVRCHMLRIASSMGSSIKAVAEDLASRYIAALSSALGENPAHSTICIMGIVPPINPFVQNPILPHVGSLAERLVAWFLLEEAVRVHARQAGFTFLPIPRSYKARDGSLKRFYSDGIAHIAKDCSGMVVQSVEKTLGLSLGFRPLPFWRHQVRGLTRRLAILNRDYAVLWTLGESNIDL